MNTIRTGKQAPANTLRNLGMYDLWAKKYGIYHQSATSHDVLFDALRLGLIFWH
jgi:hypothetical protein